jgi:hypothetical protein
MKRILSIVVLGATAVAAHAGGSTLLWDNYLSPGLGHDGLNALSSERNTVAVETWVVDDALFTDSVQILSLNWIALREIGMGAQYASADFVILDDQFQPVVSLNDLSYSATEEGSLFGLNLYEGTLTFGTADAGTDDAIILGPGQYYFGVRLVGNQLGGNYWATTGAGELNGMSYGFTKSPAFGQPGWTPVADVYGIEPTDFAFRVFGTIVPEPASFGVLALGALALTVRRRS